VSNSLAKPDGSELRCFFEVIRCVELQNWPAFYTSDKLLRLRQQKMYLMKKGSVTRAKWFAHRMYLPAWRSRMEVSFAASSRSSDVSNSLAKPDGSELRCFFEVIRCVEQPGEA
jgi:hypothetical protein